MKYISILIILLSLNILSENLYVFEKESDEIRFNNLIKDIRCPKCTSGSLASSNAPVSEDLKQKIADMIREGKSNKDIEEFVSTRYGTESLYKPEFNSSTYILWFAPFVILFLSLGFFIFRRKD